MNEINEKNIIEYSPISLALVGDGVHTLFVREKLIRQTNLSHFNLHIESSKYCRASYQSKAFDKIFEMLEEDERAIALRARNHKSHNAKNSSPQDYKKATAFEAVIGYLYLLKRTNRLQEILEYSFID